MRLHSLLLAKPCFVVPSTCIRLRHPLQTSVQSSHFLSPLFIPSSSSAMTRGKHPAARRVAARGGATAKLPVSRSQFKATKNNNNNNNSTNNNIGKIQRYYAIQYGRDGYSGVLTSWPECQYYVNGISGAVFKAFKTKSEAEAFIVAKKSRLPPTTTRTPNLTSNNNTSNRNTSTTSTTPTKNKNKSNSTTTSQYMSMSTAAAMKNNKYNTRQNNIARAQPNRSWQQNQTPPQMLPFDAKDRKDVDVVASNKGFQSDQELFAPWTAEALVKDSPDEILEAPSSIIVYTDGACSRNGTPKAKAGYGVFFGFGSPYNIAAGLKNNPTNQRAEMAAVVEAMRVTLAHGLLAENGELHLYTDSKYTKDGIEEWMPKWKKNGWLTSGGSAVSNRDVWEAISVTIDALSLRGMKLKLHWVKGHSKVVGNEMADKLAVAGREGPMHP